MDQEKAPDEPAYPVNAAHLVRTTQLAQLQLSAMAAVAAVLPAIRARKDAPLNLLFFGSFTGLGEEEYLDRLTERLRSDDSIYRTMGRDIYQNGLVLARKK